jgi:hypothetical protein
MLQVYHELNRMMLMMSNATITCHRSATCSDVIRCQYQVGNCLDRANYQCNWMRIIFYSNDVVTATAQRPCFALAVMTVIKSS